MRKYQIFHEGRCGSTAIAQVLNQHPSLSHHGEILEPQVWIAPGFDESELGMKRKARSINLSEYPSLLEACHCARSSSKRSGDCVHWCGCEVKMHHLARILQCDMAEVLNRLGEATQPKAVVLLRSNTLRHHISALRAFESGVWHVRREQKPTNHSVHLNTQRITDFAYDSRNYPLLDFLRVADARRHTLTSYAEAQGYLLIDYEQYSNRIADAAYLIFDYLGVKPVPGVVDYQKTGDRPLNQLVSNFDEVQRVLEGTEWEWMLQ